MHEYYGKRWYYVTQIFYNLSLTTHNISAIIVTAQARLVCCFLLISLPLSLPPFVAPGVFHSSAVLLPTQSSGCLRCLLTCP